MSTATRESLAHAAEHVSHHDPILHPVIERIGPCNITPHKNYYQALVNAIIGQQLSVKAAASIRRKFLDLFDGTFPLAETMLEKTSDDLRTAGLSRAKAAYVHDLARHVVTGKLHFDHLDGLTNGQVISELTDIKGVGEWTAHMFLMFCMGRLDILPVGDLGIRNGMRALYGLKDAPTPDRIRAIAIQYHWHPYESVASWYIWEALDDKPVD